MIRVGIQEAPFDAGAEMAALTKGREDVGALVSFVGLVRGGDGLEAMTLEHYPAMTQPQIEAIVKQAEQRWPILAGTVIHRHGRLLVGEPIVLVAVAAAHRGVAFEAAEFLIDWLKTKAPFWKQEETSRGRQWVEAKAGDDQAAERWETPDRNKEN